MESETPPPSPEQPTPAKRPMPRLRKKKLLIAVAVIAIALVVLFWGWSASGRFYITVRALVDDADEAGMVPEKYLDGKIEVLGLVTGWYNMTGDPDLSNFTLVDTEDVNKSVSVTMLGTFPAGFGNNTRVIVKGDLEPSLPLRIVAISITVSCPSKY